ncbi:MAG: hypothetical protein AB1489_16450 [Acidobacteriota bacterium]
MFTIQAKVAQSYQLAARQRAVFNFFTDLQNFPRHMSEIVRAVEIKKNGQSLWTIKIEISSSSALEVQLLLAATLSGEEQISYIPVVEGDDHLAIYIDIAEEGGYTNINFALELRLQRESSFDIHPLAGLLGERSINKLVQRHAEDMIGEFVIKAQTQKEAKPATEKKKKK